MTTERDLSFADPTATVFAYDAALSFAASALSGRAQRKARRNAPKFVRERKGQSSAHWTRPKGLGAKTGELSTLPADIAHSAFVCWKLSRGVGRNGEQRTPISTLLAVRTALRDHWRSKGRGKEGNVLRDGEQRELGKKYAVNPNARYVKRVKGALTIADVPDHRAAQQDIDVLGYGSPEEARMLRFFASGASLEQTAQAIGCSAPALRKRLERYRTSGYFGTGGRKRGEPITLTPVATINPVPDGYHIVGPIVCHSVDMFAPVVNRRIALPIICPHMQPSILPVRADHYAMGATSTVARRVDFDPFVSAPPC